MIVRQEWFLSPHAIRAFGPALERSNMGWSDINEIMRGLGWCVWNIDNIGWVFTMVNVDDEIEVLLAGGSHAKACAKAWERAVLREPGHKGKTLRIDGRKGWRRLFQHWDERDGVLYRKVA